MLESEARKKLCPLKMSPNAILQGPNAYCEGKICMGWDTWMETLYENKVLPHKQTSHRPKEPPEGHCGMIPPEFNCSYG